jgi:hypothetical protein
MLFSDVAADNSLVTISVANKKVESNVNVDEGVLVLMADPLNNVLYGWNANR